MYKNFDPNTNRFVTLFSTDSGHEIEQIDFNENYKIENNVVSPPTGTSSSHIFEPYTDYDISGNDSQNEKNEYLQLIIDNNIQNFLEKGKNYTFQYGMFTFLDDYVPAIFETNNEITWKLFKEILQSDRVSDDLKFGLVKSLGEIEINDSDMKEARREYLEYILTDYDDEYIQDAASVALATLGDPKSLPAFIEALEKQESTDISTIDWLQKVIHSLQE